MTEKQFLELFGKPNKYDIQYLPLNEFGYSIMYEPVFRRYFLDYYEDAELCEIENRIQITFSMALNFYDLYGFNN